MNDKRNPGINRGDGETLESYLGRVDELLSRIKWQSDGHRQWYTHKNPYGCWICELLQISEAIRAEVLVQPTDDGTDAPGLDDFDADYFDDAENHDITDEEDKYD